MLYKAAGVDLPLVSLFLALFSRQLIIQAQPAAEKFSLLRPELWCWKQMDVCATLECIPSNECCERGDVVKPVMESLRHGRLVLPSSNSMTGLVGLCT